jgi:hypothetical protein
MTQPDFIIIGAMKCGTTTVQAQLAAQPGVFMTTPKEPNFFSDDDIFARGEAWYQALFAEAAPDDLKGEASTHYTKLPTYPDTVERMVEAFEGPVRLIYMIRNPVDRVLSHYIHGWTQREITCDFQTALGKHPELVEYGLYAKQIAPFLETFGASSVFLTSLEQVKADPDGELARIGAFLGMDPLPQWHHTLESENVSANRSRKFPLHSLLIDSPLARALRQSLVPKSLRTRIRRARQVKGRPELRAPDRQRLEKTFQADQADLARLFPAHPALTACYPFLSPAVTTS